jgi:hypothetical protein
MNISLFTQAKPPQSERRKKDNTDPKLQTKRQPRDLGLLGSPGSGERAEVVGEHGQHGVGDVSQERGICLEGRTSPT